MRTTHRSPIAVIGAVLAITLIATLSLSLGTSGANATGLTLNHFLIQIGSIGALLELGSTPPPSLTGDNVFTDFRVSGGDPSLPPYTISFDVALLTPDTHIVIENVVVTLLSGCTIEFHGAYLLNLSGALTYHGSFLVNGTTQVLYNGCSAFEIFLVRAALMGGPVLVHFSLAH